MRYIMIMLLGMLLLAGCTSTPVETAPPIEYADPTQPLFEQTEEIMNTTPDWVNETPEFVNKSQNSMILTENVSNQSNLTNNVSNAFENVDLTPNGVYDSATGEKLDGETRFLVANWNLQIYGQSKAGKEEVLDFYDTKLSGYDIIFVQEIRDASGTAFPILCERFEGYECAISQRAGRSSSKEQIGVIYKEQYQLIELVDLADPDDDWERPPTRVKFNVDGYEFTAYNAHLKPDDVKAELHAFEDAVVNEGNVMVLGDLNAECSYYNPLFDNAFDSWNWLIGSGQDTTVAKSDCTYDRIIVNDDMNEEIGISGVDAEGINETYSDHYIVFAEVRG